MSIESRSNQYGTVFEHWQIQELLGQGSGGKTAVFRLARTDAARMQSALKVVNLIEERGEYTKKSDWQQREYDAALQDCKDSASQEVLLMNDFQGNTNIVDYLDHKFINWTDKLGFGCDMLIRMELLTDLRSQIQNGVSFSEEEIIKVGCDICRALVLCHSSDILHRDIKPENIFVNRNGDYKLGDFGISRIIGASPMSAASTGIGTREYAAPEQFSGKYDRRVDIYSLGLVLYELSNRFRLPFAASSYIRPEDVTKRVMGTPLQTPASASPSLSAVILKACAYKPDDRYQTAKEFMDALLGVASSGSIAPAKKESKVDPGYIEAAGYSTLPALSAESTSKKPTSTPDHNHQKSSYSTVPAIGDKSDKALSAYQTIPAKPTAVSTPTPAPKEQKIPSPPAENHSSFTSSNIPHFGKVVKQNGSDKAKTSDVCEVLYGTLVTNYREMIDDDNAEYPNPTYATDPKGRRRLFNHVTWIPYKSDEYEIVAQHTGSGSCLFFIFVVKNGRSTEPHFVDDVRRANTIFDLFKQQCNQSTSFAGVNYSYAKVAPVAESVRIPAMLCRDYKQMSDKVSASYEKPITLKGPEHRSYVFDHLTTISLNDVEYLIVAQVDAHGKVQIFIFKNPPGTANPPVFLYEGKTMRRVYRAFQNQFGGRYTFEDILEYSPSIPVKEKSGVKHFAQSTAAIRFKDGIPDVVSIEGKYHVVDSYAFKKVIKGTALIKELNIPVTVQKIEDHAFAGIVVNGRISIPESVSFIGKDAFTLSDKGYVDCEKGSYAYRYCSERGIPTLVDITERKKSSVCVYCGAAFKGLFIKRCSNPNCGKIKDY